MACRWSVVNWSKALSADSWKCDPATPTPLHCGRLCQEWLATVLMCGIPAVLAAALLQLGSVNAHDSTAPGLPWWADEEQGYNRRQKSSHTCMHEQLLLLQMKISWESFCCLRWNFSGRVKSCTLISRNTAGHVVHCYAYIKRVI